ncbi:hypothetical protein DMN91_011761 [Ooceraea biroi]|uniref:F-box domain-containing protein n=1 Tax=Ooceraea biroi TaxID=2015173 RepID=A0A3L8D7E3_OOCBI|nr:hypothetical protein DMN91_011761 [Ooceraea biroi]
MITITDLPEEMVQTILNCNIISFQDIVNFFSTCKHFYQMINGENIFWRRKFYKSWPDLKNICEEEEHKEYLDFKELVRARLNCRKELRPFLTKLSEKHYYCFYESLLSEDITWRMWLDEYRYRRYSKKVFVEEKELDALMHSNKVIHHLYYYLLMDELRSLYKRSQR